MNHRVGIWIDHEKAVIVSASANRVTVKTLHAQHLDRYYDEVIGQLGQPDALLIFGPGEAKLQLKARLSQSTVMPEPLVGIETTDKMTDPQIVAKVKDHYGIERREDAVAPAHTSKPH